LQVRSKHSSPITSGHHIQVGIFGPILPTVTRLRIIYFVTSRGSSMTLNSHRFHLTTHVVRNILNIYIFNCIHRALDDNTKHARSHTHICFLVPITLYSDHDLSVRMFRRIHTLDISTDCCSTIPSIFIVQYHLIRVHFRYQKLCCFRISKLLYLDFQILLSTEAVTRLSHDQVAIFKTFRGTAQTCARQTINHAASRIKQAHLQLCG